MPVPKLRLPNHYYTATPQHLSLSMSTTDPSSLQAHSFPDLPQCCACTPSTQGSRAESPWTLPGHLCSQQFTCLLHPHPTTWLGSPAPCRSSDGPPTPTFSLIPLMSHHPTIIHTVVKTMLTAETKSHIPHSHTCHTHSHTHMCGHMHTHTTLTHMRTTLTHICTGTHTTNTYTTHFNTAHIPHIAQCYTHSHTSQSHTPHSHSFIHMNHPYTSHTHTAHTHHSYTTHTYATHAHHTHYTHTYTIHSHTLMHSHTHSSAAPRV